MIPSGFIYADRAKSQKSKKQSRELMRLFGTNFVSKRGFGTVCMYSLQQQCLQYTINPSEQNKYQRADLIFRLFRCRIICLYIV